MEVNRVSSFFRKADVVREFLLDASGWWSTYKSMGLLLYPLSQVQFHMLEPLCQKKFAQISGISMNENDATACLRTQYVNKQSLWRNCSIAECFLVKLSWC